MTNKKNVGDKKFDYYIEIKDKEAEKNAKEILEILKQIESKNKILETKKRVDKEGNPLRYLPRDQKLQEARYKEVETDLK